MGSLPQDLRSRPYAQCLLRSCGTEKSRGIKRSVGRRTRARLETCTTPARSSTPIIDLSDGWATRDEKEIADLLGPLRVANAEVSTLR